MSYAAHLLVYLEIYVMLTLTLNLVVGYCGLYSLAHAAYFSLGAYAYAVLYVRFGVGFIPATLAGMAIAAAASLLLSLPSWRVRGDYFLMVTIAAHSLVFSLIYNWHDLGKPVGSLRNLTNGPYGIGGLPRPRFLHFEVGSVGGVAAVGLCCLLLVTLVIWRLKRSPWGKVLEALRDDELAARSLGKNARVAKAQALAIACGLAAIPGSLYASYASYVDPSICSVDDGVLMLSAVVIGGLGGFWGPVLGAGLVILVPELLRLLALPQLVAANLRLATFGLLLVLLVHFRPQGILGRVSVE